AFRDSLILNSVLQRHGPCFAVDLVPGELQLHLLRWAGQQRDTSSEKDGNHADLHGIDQSGFEEAAEERPTPKEPQVLARLRLQLGDYRLRLRGNGDVRVVLLAERARAHVDLHPRRRAATTSALHPLEGPATEEHRVKLTVEVVEVVNLRVHDDPV